MAEDYHGLINIPAPRVTRYEGSGKQGSINLGRMQGHASGPAAVYALAMGGPSLARGLEAASDELYRQEEQKQNLEAMSEVQAFRDRERMMLDDISHLAGEDGFDAPRHAMEFYQKEMEDLKGKAKGDFQRIYYEKAVNADRDTGLNAAFAHRRQELDRWEESVRLGEMSDLFNQADESPKNWRSLEDAGIESIRLANPGLDTTAKENAFRKQLVKSVVDSAMAKGDPATARSIIDQLGTSADKAELEKAFGEAQSKAMVNAGIQAGVQRSKSGESYEFYEEVSTAIAEGRLSPEEGKNILQGVKSIEETGRQQRQAQRNEQEEAAKNEWLQSEADGNFDINEFRNDTRLSADYRDRKIKEHTSTSKPSLDSVDGRSIDFKIKQAIDTGKINDLASLYDMIGELDPDGKFIASSALNIYETRLKDTTKGDSAGNPKRNYFKEAIDAVGKRNEFYGKTGTDAGSKKALRLMALEDAVYQELEREGISVYDPAAGQAVLKAAQEKVVTSPGRIWDTKEPWYKVAPEKRPSLFNRPQSQRDGGVGGTLGASMALAGPLAQRALEMAEEGESHWLTDYSPDNNAALGLEAAAEDQAIKQGLPLTPFAVQWARQGILENRPAREVVPDFAMNWPGQGKVSLETLGRVHDYNGLIERYAVSYGIDPNLIASMMYVESKGDRYAMSQAGAKGLMQFMPATAQRFGISDRSDPAQSIRGACQYMRWLLDRYDGNVSKAVGAYNAGEGNIDKGRYPKETQNYIPKVLSLWQAAAKGPGQAQSTGIQTAAGSSGLVAPLGSMTVTSKYGPRNTGIAGASRNHQGIDLRAAVGTPVGSIADGVVETAMYKGKNGNYVVVNHGNGRKSFYLHLQGYDVRPGMKVKAGQVLGRTGNSGDFKKPLAPHLDFRISENGKFVDPAKYFAGLKHKKGA